MFENLISDTIDELELPVDNTRMEEVSDWLAHRDDTTNVTGRYGHLLHQLAAKYGRVPSYIANTTVASRDLLYRSNIITSLQELLEDMVTVYRPVQSNGEYVYVEVLCMYVALRTAGMTREEACNRLVRQLSHTAMERN